MVDFNIRVIVDPTGAARGSRRVRQELTGVEQVAGRVRGLLARAFAFVTFTAAIRQLVRLGDTFISVRNQLRTVTDSEAELITVTQRLFEISQQTRTSFEGNVRLFQRLRIAADELGASQEQLFTFTERVGQALTLFGISSERARGALLQLSQGLQAGVFRAEEFNSILENAFPIAQAAARGFGDAGISVGQLRQRVIDGTLTSREFFDAFLQGSRDLEEQFAQTQATVGQGFTVLGNSLLLFVGRLEETTNQSANAAQALIALSEVVDDLGRFLFPTATERIDQLQDRLAGFRAENPAIEFFRDLAESVGLSRDALIDTDLTSQLTAQAQEDLTRETNNLLAALRQEQRELVETQSLLIDTTEQTTRFTDAQRNVIEDLEFEIFQIGRTSRERAIANALRQAETEFTDEQASAIRALAGELFDEEQRIRQRNEALERAAELAEDELRNREQASERAQQVLQDDREALRDLTDEIDPAAAATRRLNEQLALLSRAEALDPELTTERVEELREELERLNRLEVLDEQTDLASGFERGLLRVGERVNDFAATAESVIEDAFEGATNAFQDFVRTGEFDLNQFAQRISDVFLEIGTQQLFAGLFGGGGLNLFGGGGGGLGGAGGAGGLLGGLFGGVGIGSLFGFQGGVEGAPVNNLAVGRLSGVDNRLVAFRARSDETVDVNRRGESSRPVTVNINVQTPDADSFRRAQGDILLRTQTALQRSMERSSG